VPTPFPGSPLRQMLAYLLATWHEPVLVSIAWPGTGVKKTGLDVSHAAAY